MRHAVEKHGLRGTHGARQATGRGSPLKAGGGAERRQQRALSGVVWNVGPEKGGLGASTVPLSRYNRKGFLLFLITPRGGKGGEGEVKAGTRATIENGRP